MLKKIFKRIFQVLLLIFIIIQFIRPAKNKSEAINSNDITKAYPMSENVQAILKSSCYDCHSNNTVYPWYSQIQPVAWWLNDHIQEGKRELNFSEFASYSIGKQYRKLDEINKQVEEGEMPLESYLWIHKYAKLNDNQKLTLASWVTSLRDTIKKNYPADSVVRKR